MAHTPASLPPNTFSHILQQTSLRPKGHRSHQIQRARIESREGGGTAEEDHEHQGEKREKGREGAI